MQYVMTRIDANMWRVATDVLDPFSDSIDLYIIVYGYNCKVTDDGYTDYNLACLGKDVVDYKEIKAISKWDDRDELIETVLKEITNAYKDLNNE